LLNLFLASRKRKRESQNDNIIIIKMMGLGSITRIYKSLKSYNVDFEKVQLITLDKNEELCGILGFKNVHFVRSSTIIQLGWNLLKLIFYVRKKQPVHLVNYERSSNFLGIIQMISAWFTSTKTISFQTMENKIIAPNDQVYDVESKSFLELVELTHFCFSRTIKEEQESELEILIKNKKILININATDYMAFRRYPLIRFAQIIKDLHIWDSKLTFDLIGSPDEQIYVNGLIKMINDDDIELKNRCGEWSLVDLMHNLSDCALLVTNDSGPMHMAALINIPTVVIWGPTSPSFFGYQSINVTNIESEMSCSPCFTNPKSKAAISCNGRIDCMRNIDITKILEEFKSRIKNTRPMRHLNKAYFKEIEYFSLTVE
jgi:hypothetical protein